MSDSEKRSQREKEWVLANFLYSKHKANCIATVVSYDFTLLLHFLSFSFFKIFYLLFSVWVFDLHLCLCTMCTMCRVHKGQKQELDSLRLELEQVVSHCVGAGNQNPVP